MPVLFRTFIAVICFAAVSVASAADIDCSQNPVPRPGFIGAVGLERPAPKYPNTRESEGWASVRYSIGTDGRPVNVIVSDAIGPKGFADATVKGLDNWRFKPATLNGQPTKVYLYQLESIYRLEGTNENWFSKDFLRAYDGAFLAVKDGRNDETIAAIEPRMKRALSLPEFAAGSYLLAVAYAGKDDIWRALNHIRHATIRRAQYLQKSIRTDALVFRIDLEARVGSFFHAACTHQLLAELDPAAVAPTSEATKIMARAKSLMDSPNPIVVGAKLVRQPSYDDAPASWEHTLMRTTFSFAEPSAPNLTFQLSCGLFEHVGKIDTNTLWDIPPGSGRCILRVEGPPDTTFKVVQEHSP